MNKDYYEAKAELCRDLAIKQLMNGDSSEGGKNLFRMVNALNQINYLNQKEEESEQATSIL